MFGNYLFLSSDSLSAKSVSHGIDIATEKYNEYPIWMPWMFGGLPSTHSMQNISEYYFPHQNLLQKNHDYYQTLYEQQVK